MSVFKEISKNVGIMTSEAKKTYDAKKLELRIKNYRKEETELYTKLGKMLYQTQALDNSEFSAIYNNIDAIRARMKHLDKQITDIKSKPEEEAAPNGYLQLNRKESDFTITRTNEGIRLIRLCPECQSDDTDRCQYKN